MSSLSSPQEKRGFLELAIRRLNVHRPLGPNGEAAVRGLRSARRLVRAGEVLIHPADTLHLVLDGWGCQVSRLPDGRRQIIDLVLPGDPIGLLPDFDMKQRGFGWEALTPVVLAEAGALADIEGMDAALQLARQAIHTRRCIQIVRLGMHSAYERIGHLLLELRQRQGEICTTDGDRFPFPLSQKTVGEALGLTGAHVNRIFRQMRTDGTLVIGKGWLALPGHSALAEQVGFRS